MKTTFSVSLGCQSGKTDRTPSSLKRVQRRDTPQVASNPPPKRQLDERRRSSLVTVSDPKLDL